MYVGLKRYNTLRTGGRREPLSGVGFWIMSGWLDGDIIDLFDECFKRIWEYYHLKHARNHTSIRKFPQEYRLIFESFAAALSVENLRPLEWTGQWPQKFGRKSCVFSVGSSDDQKDAVNYLSRLQASSFDSEFDTVYVPLDADTLQAVNKSIPRWGLTAFSVPLESTPSADAVPNTPEIAFPAASRSKATSVPEQDALIEKLETHSQWLKKLQAGHDQLMKHWADGLSDNLDGDLRYPSSPEKNRDREAPVVKRSGLRLTLTLLSILLVSVVACSVFVTISNMDREVQLLAYVDKVQRDLSEIKALVIERPFSERNTTDKPVELASDGRATNQGNIQDKIACAILHAFTAAKRTTEFDASGKSPDIPTSLKIALQPVRDLAKWAKDNQNTLKSLHPISCQSQNTELP